MWRATYFGPNGEDIIEKPLQEIEKMPEITGQVEPHEIDDKRFSLPGIVIKDNCPNCGKLREYDLNQIAISYPKCNEPIDFDMYCGDGCEHEWKIRILIKLGVELA